MSYGRINGSGLHSWPWRGWLAFAVQSALLGCLWDLSFRQITVADELALSRALVIGSDDLFSLNVWFLKTYFLNKVYACVPVYESVRVSAHGGRRTSHPHRTGVTGNCESNSNLKQGWYPLNYWTISLVLALFLEFVVFLPVCILPGGFLLPSLWFGDREMPLDKCVSFSS